MNGIPTFLNVSLHWNSVHSGGHIPWNPNPSSILSGRVSYYTQETILYRNCTFVLFCQSNAGLGTVYTEQMYKNFAQRFEIILNDLEVETVSIMQLKFWAQHEAINFFFN